MPTLSRAEVEQIALLARLRLDDDEAERMGVELGAILVHMDALAEVDTTGVEPMTHAVPMALRLRPDEVAASLPQALALRGAAETADGSFVVPHIIDKAGR